MSASDEREDEAAAAENVFLIPIDSDDSDDYDRTVRSPVDLSARSDRPPALDAFDEARLWGLGTGTHDQQVFERMERGDLVVFYRDGAYIGVGTVGSTFDDPDGWASATLWDDASAEHVYMIEDFRSVDVPRPALNRVFDYGADYSPPRPMRVADDRITTRIRSIHLAIMRYDEKHNRS